MVQYFLLNFNQKAYKIVDPISFDKRFRFLITISQKILFVGMYNVSLAIHRIF